MKFVFSDSPTIDGLILRRLMLLGTELTFVERPSIQLADNFGTVGVPSNVEGIKSLFDGSPIKINIGQPPTSVFASDFYKEYFYKDLENGDFIDTVVDGIQNDWIYHWYFDTKDNKNEGEFKDFKNWIIQNRKTLKNINYEDVQRPNEVFKVTSLNDAHFAFRTILSEESLRVTAALNIAENFNSNPLSISPYLNKLINLRISDRIYTGKVTRSRQLGFRLFESMIPDKALFHLSVEDILNFREKTKEYYEAWEIELKKMESVILADGGLDFEIVDIQKLLDENLNPRLQEYKNEIRKVRNEMFATVLKIIKNVGISIIAGGTLSTINIPAAIAGFIATNLKTPKLSDEIINAHFKIKNIKNENGLTYLMKVNQLVDKKGRP